MADAGPLIYLVACEPSADQLGAFLMKALMEETNGRIRFAGIGGSRMAAAGLPPGVFNYLNGSGSEAGGNSSGT